MSRLNLLEALTDNIVIDPDKCVFCGLCVDTCILDNLRMKLAPCRQACPLGVNAQGYVQLIARGEDEKAREMVRRDLPFPEIISRICEAPCEGKCTRVETDGRAVAVRALKRYLFDPAPGDLPLPEKAQTTGKKAAVVGSGPAGLCAAYDLLLAGHDVTVFEADQKPGGLLRQAVPAFRLPLEVVERDLAVLDELGLTWECGTRVGTDLTLDQLEQEFDAVVLAAGLGGQRSAGFKGEDLKGVHQGMDLLALAKQGRGPELSGRVVVIGGGNAAVDAAQTALRLGAAQVTVVALETEGQLPALENEVDLACREGVRFVCGWGPETMVAEQGRIKALDLKRCTSVFDDQGCFAPCFNREETMTLECGAVVVAVSQAGDTLKKAGGEGLAADPLTLQTGRDKVFLAGDCQEGPGSAVRAMASGRKAAESVNRLLAGEDLRFNRAYAGPVVTEYEIDTSRGSTQERIAPEMRLCQGTGDFKEQEQPYTPEQAKAEAGRCHSCGGPFGKYRNCWFCLPCEVECPEEALWVEVPYLLR